MTLCPRLVRTVPGWSGRSPADLPGGSPWPVLPGLSPRLVRAVPGWSPQPVSPAGPHEVCSIQGIDPNSGFQDLDRLEVAAQAAVQ